MQMPHDRAIIEVQCAANLRDRVAGLVQFPDRREVIRVAQALGDTVKIACMYRVFHGSIGWCAAHAEPDQHEHFHHEAFAHRRGPEAAAQAQSLTGVSIEILFDGL